MIKECFQTQVKNTTYNYLLHTVAYIYFFPAVKIICKPVAHQFQDRYNNFIFSVDVFNLNS